MKRAKVWLFGVLLVTLGVAYLGRETWQMYRRQNALKETNDARMRAAENERADLLRRKAEINSPIGKERLARQNGYKAPGEEPIELSP